MFFANRLGTRRRWTPAVGVLTLLIALSAVAAAPAASTRAATPIVSSACPQTVSGSVRLETDLACADTGGLIVGADNTTIDLNGHKIVCTGSGYAGSCQGGSTQIGVDTNGFDNVHVFSHVTGGTIDGFDRGVYVKSLSDSANVGGLTITGPALSAVPPYRPSVYGVLVEGDHCAAGADIVSGNDVGNHTTGIRLSGASCVTVSGNTVHDNSGGDPDLTLNVGIRIRNSSTNVVSGNVVTHNGSGVVSPPPPDSGIDLDNALSTGNQVVGNRVNSNNGEGIAVALGAAGNTIVNNEMHFNSQFDAFSDDTGSNNWNANNRCRTQTSPQPQAGVCNPGE